MKETTGLWVYRVAFLAATVLSLALLRCVMLARAVWFPAYEEKLLVQMKQMEIAFMPPPKLKIVKKTVVKKKMHKRNVKRIEVKS